MEYPKGQRSPEERRAHIASAVELMVAIHGSLQGDAQNALVRYVEGKISLEEALTVFRNENSNRVLSTYRPFVSEPSSLGKQKQEGKKNPAE